MTASTNEPPRTVTADITLGNKEWQLRVNVTVPTGPTLVGDMLPLARGLADAVVDRTCKAVEEIGEKVSCKAGCGACCRNLVAISEVEARQLRALVEALPEPRRSVVRARFADAVRRLGEAGLLEKLRRAVEWTDAEYGAIAEKYFRQQVACPFLEDESCSIHPERPITCREYLVVSPAENCSRPTSENIRRVALPLRVFNAVARWQVPGSVHFLERWIPLVLALEWTETHPHDPPPKPGVELLRELLDHLANKRTDLPA